MRALFILTIARLVPSFPFVTSHSPAIAYKFLLHPQTKCCGHKSLELLDIYIYVWVDWSGSSLVAATDSLWRTYWFKLQEFLCFFPQIWWKIFFLFIRLKAETFPSYYLSVCLRPISTSPRRTITEFSNNISSSLAWCIKCQPIVYMALCFYSRLSWRRMLRDWGRWSNQTHCIYKWDRLYTVYMYGIPVFPFLLNKYNGLFLVETIYQPTSRDI